MRGAVDEVTNPPTCGEWREQRGDCCVDVEKLDEFIPVVDMLIICRIIRFRLQVLYLDQTWCRRLGQG